MDTSARGYVGEAATPSRQIDTVIGGSQELAHETRQRLKKLLNRLRGPQPEPAAKVGEPSQLHPSLLTRAEDLRSELASIADLLNEVETFV